MKNFLNFKFVLILFTLAFFIFAFSVNSFANETITTNDIDIVLNDEQSQYEYFIITAINVQLNGGTTRRVINKIYFSNSPIYLNYYGLNTMSDGSKIGIDYIPYCDTDVYYSSITGQNFSGPGSVDLSFDYSTCTVGLFSIYHSSDDKYSTKILLPLSENEYENKVYGTFIYSNYDIYDTSGNLVFQGAPSRVEPMKEIQQVEEIPQAIMKIVNLILPIFLIIFGILLVLYLIKSKNLLHL